MFECELHWAELYIVDRCSGRIKFVPMKSSLVVRSSKLRHLSVMTLSYAIFLCESEWWVCCQYRPIVKQLNHLSCHGSAGRTSGSVWFPERR